MIYKYYVAIKEWDNIIIPTINQIDKECLNICQLKNSKQELNL